MGLVKSLYSFVEVGLGLLLRSHFVALTCLKVVDAHAVKRAGHRYAVVM
jgi:hypothetical protein